MTHKWNLIGLTGAQRSGKDTVAGILTQGPGARRVTIADRLRQFALDFDPAIDVPDGGSMPLSILVETLGWETAKSIPGVRATLQGVGRAVRAQWPNLLINQLRADIVAHGDAPVVVTDVRMPAEADTVLKLGGIVVRVVRDDHARA